MLSLEEAIAHCLEVAEEQEDFDEFQCDYRKLGCEDGVWKRTCRLPSNIPEGCSWGECSESNCPLFSKCLECAKDHRQLAEWLRELKAYKEERVSCEYCKYNGRQQHERPCSLCKRNFMDMFEREVTADDD